MMGFATKHALIVAALAAVFGEFTRGIFRKVGFTVALLLVAYLAWDAWTE